MKSYGELTNTIKKECIKDKEISIRDEEDTGDTPLMNCNFKKKY